MADPRDDRPGRIPLLLGLAGATTAFAAVFRGPRDRFWARMTLTAAGLGSWALLTSRRGRIGFRCVSCGDRFARRYVPTGDADIRDIYALRRLRPRAEIATRLALVIGPAEEVFWRGLVQEALMRRYGRWPGAALAAAAYGGVHVTSGNFTLLGAAATAGAHWCVLYAARVPLGALIVSHVAWDIWIFLVQPTGEVEAIGPSGQVVPFRVVPAA